MRRSRSIARVYGGSRRSPPSCDSPSTSPTAGVASRRAAEQLIFAGRVTVDGEVVTDPARDVTGAERIDVDGERVGAAPGGARRLRAATSRRASSRRRSDTHGRPTVVDLVRAPGDRRLYPVGRLDADSTGLILLTDDGDLAHRLTHPRFEVPKTYVAQVGGKRVSDGALRRLRERRRARGRAHGAGRGAPARGARARADAARGPQAPGAPHVRGRRPSRCARCERISFGPLKLGRLPEGARAPAAARRDRRAARRGRGARAGGDDAPPPREVA